MNAKFQRRIQRYGWDKAASLYEQYWQNQLYPAQSCLLEMADLQAGERVLDTACGTGLVTFRAAQGVGKDGEVVGTDISDGMIELATHVAEIRNINNVSFRQMDAEALSFPAESFDAALSALGLLYLPDPLKGLQEMYRVLKPGGRAVAAVWGHRSRCGWADIFPIVDARVRSEVCPMFFHLGTGDTLPMHFELAGFARIVTERINPILHYPTADEALGAAFAGGPVALAYSRFDEQTREEAHREYLQSIEPYRNSKGYNIPGEFVITAGVKDGHH
ncbi:MAG: methyltransferase domain-containing protein [Gammaproteobacteria bacterium]|nr:methyltransferase domain-containing protein [Gammaproteobacteria bacterium]NIW49980.1 methyltransferase domain-containing protein [Gammaproteobacteria bacterium]NIW99392.1 methyltransferase domain-containing protein [Phycisphaerae bacterium]